MEQRVVGEPAQSGGAKLGAGWIDRAEIAVIDIVPGGKFRADGFELRIVRRVDVRIESSLLDFSFPLVTPEIVAGLERQRDQTQSDHDPPENSFLRGSAELRGNTGDRREIRDTSHQRD